jgi:Putative metallopeptidase
MHRSSWGVLVVAAVAACSAGGARGPDADTEGGRFRARYGPATAEFTDFRDRLVNNRFLDTVATRLNDSLRIPKDITLATSHCEEPNASYDPTTSRVTLCYELFESLGEQFASETGGEYLVAGTIVFALMHETAHALIDVLDLPTTGREEDAADQLATLLLLDEGATGDSLAFGAVGWLATNAHANPLDTLAFADDHALDIQRVYNILCLIYGRDPLKYPEVVEDGWLPVQRRDRCPAEYHRLRDTWRRLLAPYHR